MNTQHSIQIGDSFNSFYGNGEPSGAVIVVRLTEKSIFVKRESCNYEWRVAINSVNKFLAKGLWKKK